MLVLSRQEDETIVIGQDIEVTVLEIGEDIVHLRLSFPLRPQNLFIEFWTGAGEEVRIGDGIILKVTELKGDRVRIGTEASTNVEVHRKELLDRPAPPPEGQAQRRLRPSPPGQRSGVTAAPR